MNRCCCLCSWMGCSCQESKDQPVAEIKQASERHCTDVVALLVYAASWLAVIIIFASASEQGGDPNRLLHGVDYLGRTCGTDSGVKGKEFAAWPYPPAWEFMICVDSCDDTLTDPLMTVQQKSTEFVYWCVPLVNANNTDNVQLSGDFDNTSQAASRAIGDILVAWPVIFTSLFLALIFSFLYTNFVKYCAGCVVWGTALIILLAGILISFVFLEKAAEYEEEQETDNRVKAVRTLGWISVAGTVIFLCVIIALRNQIKIAVAVIKLSAKVMDDMKMLVFFPLMPLFLGAGYLVFWIAVSLYIFSVGSLENEPIPDGVQDGNAQWQALAANGVEFRNFEWNEELKDSFAIHFFHLLWTVQFMIYFTYLVSAGAVADWYFTRMDGHGNKIRGNGKGELSNSPIRESCWRGCRFHTGSIAIGSFIIAVIQFVRAIVKYIEEQSKAQEQTKLQKWLIRCISCCLWCAECCMDKVNQNAFIWMSIYGDNFGSSCCNSFKLVWSNLIRAAAINLVGGYLILLGKVTVALLTAASCGLFLLNNGYFQEHLSSVAMPVFVIFILAYLVAALFMVTFETAVDVTFFCFLVDEEANKQSGTMFASEDLQKLVNAYSEQSKAMARHQMDLRNYGRPQDQHVGMAGLDEPPHSDV